MRGPGRPASAPIAASRRRSSTVSVASAAAAASPGFIAAAGERAERLDGGRRDAVVIVRPRRPLERRHGLGVRLPGEAGDGGGRA